MGVVGSVCEARMGQGWVGGRNFAHGKPTGRGEAGGFGGFLSSRRRARARSLVRVGETVKSLGGSLPSEGGLLEAGALPAC